ncbi:DUF6000 family protein [Streptomyces microflavus]
MIRVGRRTTFRERIDDLLLTSEFYFVGSGYCFALARFGTLLHLDARLGTYHADRLTEPDGL